MKRSWFGFVLLILLLFGCFLSTRVMTAIHEPIEAELLQAARYAMDGNWEKAGKAFWEAEESWKQWEHVRSCFADHTPVEEIDGDFELLKVFCAAREGASFAGGCLQLARQVAAVGEAHELVWWNLL